MEDQASTDQAAITRRLLQLGFKSKGATGLSPEEKEEQDRLHRQLSSQGQTAG